MNTWKEDILEKRRNNINQEIYSPYYNLNMRYGVMNAITAPRHSKTQFEHSFTYNSFKYYSQIPYQYKQLNLMNSGNESGFLTTYSDVTVFHTYSFLWVWCIIDLYLDFISVLLCIIIYDNVV